jgi:hypothetical protein
MGCYLPGKVRHLFSLVPQLLTISLDMNQKPFGVSWQSAMNYLIAPITDPPRLTCADETGIDKFGADEIRLEMQLDSAGPWIELIRQDDVDSDEQIMIPTIPMGSFRSTDTGFVNHVKFKVIEEDTLPNDEDNVDMGGLPTHVYESSSEVTLEPGTGEYRVYFKIRREP